MYIALGIIFLISTLVIVVFIIYNIVKSAKNGENIISKKNLFFLAPIFILIYLLHLTAAVYSKAKIDFFFCFSLINTVLDTLACKVETSLVLPICKAYPIFYADFVIAFVVGVTTVILSIASFFGRRISNFIRVRYSLHKKYDVVLGDSSDALKYIKNVKKCLLLGVDLSSQRYTELIRQGVVTLRVRFDIKLLSRKLKRSGYNIIVFRDSEYSYGKIIDVFEKLNENKIYLEANQEEMKILKEKFITKFDNKTNIYVSGFSKYELMARRFVADYPITKFIPRNFYNSNCTLKKDKKINVVFIGFGKVNYQLFRMCAMQFQFAKETEDRKRLVSEPVNYYIYDDDERTLHNEFFSRILYEFDEDFKNSDFPKPEKICNLEVKNADINSIDVKKEFKKLVDDNNFTYFVISLKSDLEDASYAQTISRLFECNNYKIFVRAKNNNGERLNEVNDKIIYFGEEKELYTHDNIVNDELIDIAQRINLLYEDISNTPSWYEDILNNVNEKVKEQNLTLAQRDELLNEALNKKDNHEKMVKMWNELEYIQKDSNLYHALNLHFKLNMLGVDMVKKNYKDDSGMTEDEFKKIYKNTGYKEEYKDYSFFFKTESSNVLAYIEHSRWNALYILYDYKPMNKKDMKLEEDKKGNKTMAHKDTEHKKHACLTTYYGLNELITYKYKCMHPEMPLSEENYKNNANLQEISKIYAYDYMDLDKIYREITSMGYKLVKNEDKKEEKAK